MKIYYFSDESFLDMKNKFEYSFKDNFEKKFKYLDNVNLDRNQPGSGIDIWKYKTSMIINAIKENKNDIILVSDIDIIFYRPVEKIIEQCMINTDCCFQKETSTSGINIGFISIRCNESMLYFWNIVNEKVCNTNVWDQEIVNDLIYNKKEKIRWGLFPSSVWNWSQGDLNKSIILHHANCVSKKEEKYEQMEYVYNYINNE